MVVIVLIGSTAMRVQIIVMAVFRLEATRAYFNVRPNQLQLLDRYNVAPTSNIPVIRLIDGGGLVPCWTEDTKSGCKMINARA